MIAVWNLCLPEEKGEAKERDACVSKASGGNRRVLVSRVDATHGSPLHAYEAMGRPAYPTAAQIEELRQAARAAAARKDAVQQRTAEIDASASGIGLDRSRGDALFRAERVRASGIGGVGAISCGLEAS